MIKNNFYCNNFLTKCDLINKYLLTNVQNFPQLDFIDLKISLGLLLKDQNEMNELRTKIKIFIIFFLLNFNKPLLKYNSLEKNSKINTASNVSDFKVSLRFSNRESIHKFLLSLFIENTQNLKVDTKLYVIRNIFQGSNDILKARLEVPLNNLFDFSYLTDSNIFSINSKEVLVSLDIAFKTKSLVNKNYLLKNLPFFWYI